MCRTDQENRIVRLRSIVLFAESNYSIFFRSESVCMRSTKLLFMYRGHWT